MTDSKIIALKQPGEITDHLHDALRAGAQELLAHAIEAEVEDFLAKWSDEKLANGQQRVVRHGHLPERKVLTALGPVKVRKPRIRVKKDSGTAEQKNKKIEFKSLILPNYLRRSKDLDEMLPYLYLKGISLGNMADALSGLWGEVPNLSGDTVRRLKKKWSKQWKTWRKRDLSAKRYIYIWADGIYLGTRDDDKQCILVIIGATPEGKKELIGFCDGYRESTQSWRELLVDLKERGLSAAPKLAVGDGAMGFWKAIKEVYSATRHQRCWVHKTANILNKMPKSIHAKAKAKEDIHEIWMAEDKKTAKKDRKLFVTKYGTKYPKATTCLEKNKRQLLAFYDFPAEHWKHIRTTNPIESTFATVRHRTINTKGCLSRKTAAIMVFKLVEAAQKNWKVLDGKNQLPKIIEGVRFKNGLELKPKSQKRAA